MKSSFIALGFIGILVVALLIAAGSYVGAKNHMVALNEEINQTYSQVNIEQQRRLDLIPNLVASVKGYVKEEESVLTNIANARAGVLSTQTSDSSPSAANIQANERLSTAIVPLFRLQEAYPDLKGNEQFMRLEDELAGTENRIAVERKRYNESLQTYNTYVQQFPASLWAGIAGFHAKDDQYFKGNPDNNVAPTVDFNK